MRIRTYGSAAMTDAKHPAQRRRRNPTPGFRQLSCANPNLLTPQWPLGHPTKKELEKWAWMWTLPQAVEWERNRDYDTVALYVRMFIKIAHAQKIDVRLLCELRALDAKIGISARALRNLRWEIATPEESIALHDVSDLRRRIRAVDDVG